jgi:hypothetical protein
MMIAIVILAIWHPGRTLLGPESVFPKLTRKEKKAMKKAKKEEKAARKMEKKLDRSSQGQTTVA